MRPETAPVTISVVIVNWNSREYVRNCLLSLRRERSVPSLELIVVDSGSFDGCGEMLRREFPEALFVQSAENLGFARANNLGARHASGDFLLLLNPDTEVQTDAVSRLVDAALTIPRLGVLGARLLNTDGSVQTTCIRSFPTLLNQLLESEVLRTRYPRSALWGAAALYDETSAATPVQAVSGACMLIKRDMFWGLGGFSEEYFMYSEDIDLCMKAQRAGAINYFAPAAVIVHHGGGATKASVTGFSDVMMRKSRWRYFIKFRGPLYAFAFRCSIAGAALVRTSVATMFHCACAAFNRHSFWQHSAKKWARILCWAAFAICPSPLTQHKAQ